MIYLHLRVGENINDREQNILIEIISFNKDFQKGFGQNHMHT